MHHLTCGISSLLHSVNLILFTVLLVHLILLISPHHSHHLHSHHLSLPLFHSISSHITPILRSLHWLKINERIEYKLLPLTYKILTTSQPDYLHNLISVQSSGRTRSSSVVTLARPSVSSSLQITNRSFSYATSPVESTLFFIPSTSLCSLSSWLTSSYVYHLITVITFFLTICHSLDLSL